nr:ribonuclease H-like domain-containing protein [Tanacetum cinerariifolium]
MSIKDSEINVLESELEKIKQEKEGIQFKIENFDNASKNLDKFLRSQITDKSKNGLGFQSYNVVPPPTTLVYNTGRCPPPKIDLSYSGLEEFIQHEFKSYEPKSCEIESKNASEDIPNELKGYPDAPLVKDRVSNSKDCLVESFVVVEKKIVVPTIAKVEVVRPKQQKNQLGKQLVNTARASLEVVNAVRENLANVVKASILLRVPRKNNMYSVDLKNIVPKESLTCLVAKTTLDESMLWHRRLGHINFKNINKLVKDNLVREIENLVDKKVKVIRCDNGKEFKNSVMNDFCIIKDHLGKFDEKADEGFFVGYSMNSKAFRVYNISCNAPLRKEDVMS